MSYYFLLDAITRQSERAVMVKPTAKNDTPNPPQWLPKSAIGIWNHEGRLIIGIDDFYKLPETSANWQPAEMTAGELIGMRRTAEEVNLYNHVEGWRK